jgi:Ca2+-binding EF-hand superfamily protein
MGCSHGKTTKPSAVGVNKTTKDKTTKPPTTESPPTLLSPSNAQKQKVVVEDGVGASGDYAVDSGQELTRSSETAAIQQDAEKDWPLRWKALRVFAMADKTMHGLLDVKELTADGNDVVFHDMLQGVLGGHADDLLSLSAWLGSMKKLALGDEVKAGLFLDLCLKHVSDQQERWPLRDEALQVFRMGDGNGDYQLDMNELTEIRQSADFAQAMINSIDIDKDGTVSKGEWLAYVKRLADQNEESAAAVLALYRKQLGESSNTAEAYDAAKSAMNALVEDSSANTTQGSFWWACC